MRKVHGELEDGKADFSGKLKKVPQEQLCEAQEANGVQKPQELGENLEEFSVDKELESLGTDPVEKESHVNNLHSSNDKLHLEYREKLIQCEEEKKRLLLAVDEANERNRIQAEKIIILVKEVENLTEISGRGYLTVMLEEEKRNVDDQLKWKTEQFDHLEEAHEKLRNKFQSCKIEWEEEKAQLLEDISRLHTSLNSESKATLGLRNQLEMRNQALLCEEKQRKKLEVQISEMKYRLEDVTIECEEAKSLIQCSTSERNDESSALRNSLRIKETLCKEMEYKAKKLEQENHELLNSLKELQEAQIPKAYTPPPSSLVKLRSKLKNLEQTHKECSFNQRAREAEWCLQREKMAQELDEKASHLKTRDAEIDKLKLELQGCHSSITELKLQNEELSLMLQLLRSEFSLLQSRHEEQKFEMDLNREEENAGTSFLKEQVKLKNASLVKAESDIEKEREKCAALLLRVEALNALEQRQLLMQEELEKYKGMLEQSSRDQLILKEEAADMERILREELHETSSALEAVNSEFAEKFYEGCDLELDLRVWRTKVDCLKMQVEEHRLTRRDLESSLLEQAEFEERLKQEIIYLTGMVEEKDRIIADLQLGRSHEVRHEGDELYPPKENDSMPHTPATKISCSILDDRWALRELN